MVKPGNTFGYFGKLPCFNDFVKYNAGGEELLVIDKWLQDGLLSAKMKLKSEWIKYYKNSNELFFFFPFTGTGRALSGILFFSMDKSGREFPFIVFNMIDKKKLSNIPSHLLPMILLDTLDELKNSVDDISLIDNLSALNERLNNIYTAENNFNDKNNLYNNYLNGTAQTIFWDRIIDEYDEEAKLSFLINLYQQKENKGTVTISFLSPDDYFLNDLTFLIHLTFKFLKVSDSFPSIFWTKSEDRNQFLYIFINKLLPDNFIYLIRRSDESRQDISEKHNVPVKSSFENLLNRDITLKEFLNSI